MLSKCICSLIILLSVIPCTYLRIPPGCKGEFDVTFILDQSESLRENDPFDQPDFHWNILKGFVKGIIQSLPVGFETKVAMVKYSSVAEVQWYLNEYTYTLDIEAQVDALQCYGGNTNTADALQVTREKVFKPERGDRKSTKNIIILFNDGLSTVRSGDDLYSQAKALHRDGVEIYVVAVGKHVDEEEIRRLVLDFSKNIIKVQDFDRLRAVQRLLAYRLCGLPDPPPEPQNPEDCDRIMDLTLLVDNSGSITDKNKDNETDNYLQLKRFLLTLVEQIDIRPGGTRVSVVRFSDVVHIEFKLGHYRDREDLKGKILSMPFRGLDTNTSGAIRTAVKDIYSGSNGDRPGVQDVVILITDGESTIEQNRTVHEALMAKRNGIKMFVVGVTNEINTDELMEIASEPAEKHFFDSTAVKYLQSIIHSIILNVCQKT